MGLAKENSGVQEPEAALELDMVPQERSLHRPPTLGEHIECRHSSFS